MLEYISLFYIISFASLGDFDISPILFLKILMGFFIQVII